MLLGRAPFRGRRRPALGGLVPALRLQPRSQPVGCRGRLLQQAGFHLAPGGRRLGRSWRRRTWWSRRSPSSSSRPRSRRHVDDASPRAARPPRAGGAALAILGWSVFALSPAIRTAARTQFLSAPGIALLLAALFGLIACLAPARRARIGGGGAGGVDRRRRRGAHRRHAAGMGRAGLLDAAERFAARDHRRRPRRAAEHARHPPGPARAWPATFTFRHALLLLYEGRAIGLVPGAHDFLYPARFADGGVSCEPWPVIREPWDAPPRSIAATRSSPSPLAATARWRCWRLAVRPSRRVGRGLRAAGAHRSRRRSVAARRILPPAARWRRGRTRPVARPRRASTAAPPAGAASRRGPGALACAACGIGYPPRTGSRASPPARTSARLRRGVLRAAGPGRGRAVLVRQPPRGHPRRPAPLRARPRGAAPVRRGLRPGRPAGLPRRATASPSPGPATPSSRGWLLARRRLDVPLAHVDDDGPPPLAPRPEDARHVRRPRAPRRRRGHPALGGGRSSSPAASSWSPSPRTRSSSTRRTSSPSIAAATAAASSTSASAARASRCACSRTSWRRCCPCSSCRAPRAGCCAARTLRGPAPRELGIVPALNALLRGVLAVERQALRVLRPPFGTSLLAVPRARSPRRRRMRDGLRRGLRRRLAATAPPAARARPVLLLGAASSPSARRHPPPTGGGSAPSPPISRFR